MTSDSRNQALSFGAAAAHYDRIRPSYPQAAVRWCIRDADGTPAAFGRVVDLGAGTGLLTRVIRQVTPAALIAVEPDELMRERLAENTAGVTALEGRAEAIPLPDSSVDAVLAGQAYHWFDRDKAHLEIGRVLRAGGAFAPIWNIRDESVDWVAEYTRLIGHSGLGHPGHPANLDFGPLFADVSMAAFQHSVTMDADGLVALLASRSYYLTAKPDDQVQLASNVRSLARTLPETFEMPYVTYCYRAIRR